MKIIRGIIVSPLWLVVAISSLFLLAALRAISVLTSKETGTLFLQKILGNDVNNWIVTIEESHENVNDGCPDSH
jgi:hypothetical protein